MCIPIRHHCDLPPAPAPETTTTGSKTLRHRTLTRTPTQRAARSRCSQTFGRPRSVVLRCRDEPAVQGKKVWSCQQWRDHYQDRLTTQAPAGRPHHRCPGAYEIVRRNRKAHDLHCELEPRQGGSPSRRDRQSGHLIWASTYGKRPRSSAWRPSQIQASWSRSKRPQCSTRWLDRQGICNGPH